MLEPEHGTELWIYFDHEGDPDAPWSGSDVFPLDDALAFTDAQRWVNQGPLTDEGDEIRFDSVFTVERFTDRVVYRLDHRIASADHDHPLDEDHSAPLYIRFSNTGSSSFWASRVRVRLAANPPPELTLGAREDLPSP